MTSLSTRLSRGILRIGLAAAAAGAVGAGFGLWPLPSALAQEGVKIPAPQTDMPAGSARTETAVFAGGCFWGVQGVFQHVTGVANAVSGYAGGAKDTADYHRVGTGRTGHAEAVKVTFDPSKVSYGKLLQVYFSVAHDPTTLNYQGPDHGTQYRSAIFPQDGSQAKMAQAYIEQLDKAKLFDGKIVTTIEPDKAFYPAEAYHQDFLMLNPTYPYIVFNDLPKIENLKKILPDVYSDDPALVSEATASN